MGLPRALEGLADKRVWVAWSNERGRKVPKSPHGGNARSNDPSTWGTYAEAETARAKNGFAGVGLMLTDGYVGVDLDGAVEDGEVLPWARSIVEKLASYAEFSPSGSGIHVIAWADPGNVGPVGRADHRRGIEVYNHGRYFTVTGEELPGEGIVRDVTKELPGFLAENFSGEPQEQAVRRCVGNLARDQVKRQANRTMAENCARDGVRYARVPVGAETCGFCIMLASRGFAYTTPEAASHAHDGCDCKVVPGFDGVEVEGYDPDALYDLYSDARDRVEERGGRPASRETIREIECILTERAGTAVGAMRYSPSRSEHVSVTKKQLGRKFGKHALEWGIDFNDPGGRDQFCEIIDGIVNGADDIARGEWRGQPGPCTFFKRGDDLVIVNARNEFVTVMKGGGSNVRYQRAVGRIGD